MSTAQFVHVKGHRMSLLHDKQSYIASELFTHREKITQRYCDAIINNPTAADEATWKELQAEFSEPEPVEMGTSSGSCQVASAGCLHCTPRMASWMSSWPSEIRKRKKPQRQAVRLPKLKWFRRSGPRTEVASQN